MSCYKVDCINSTTIQSYKGLSQSHYNNSCITVQDKILMFPSFYWKNHSQRHFQSFHNWYITLSKDLTVLILCYSLSELGVQRINLSNKAVFVFRKLIRSAHMVQKFLGLNISNNINDRNKIPVLFYNESRVFALAKYFLYFLYFVAIRNIYSAMNISSDSYVTKKTIQSRKKADNTW